MTNALAIVSGTGALPRLIAEECRRIARAYLIVVLEGTELDWLADHPSVSVPIEKQSRLFKLIRKAECDSVVFAGAMSRPQVNPLKFDGNGMKLMTKVMNAKRQGDDESLRIILEYYESQGFKIEAAQDILPDLLPPAGVLTKLKPSDHDRADAVRATEIVAGMGALDLGQGTVVAARICLGLESAQGTDSMLAYVAQSRENFSPNGATGRGLLLKSPKPGQDLRVDLPAIGPNTIRLAHAAGLAGIVIVANGIMILERAETIAEADRLGVFIWVRDA